MTQLVAGCRVTRTLKEREPANRVRITTLRARANEGQSDPIVALAQPCRKRSLTFRLKEAFMNASF